MHTRAFAHESKQTKTLMSSQRVSFNSDASGSRSGSSSGSGSYDEEEEEGDDDGGEVDVKEIAVRRQKPPKKSTPVAANGAGDDEDDKLDVDLINAIGKRMSRSATSQPATGYEFKTWERYAKDQQDSNVRVLKIAIVGSYGIGKTMLVHRFTQQIESPTQQPRNITVRAEHFDLPILIGHPHYKTRVLVSIWDTPGQTMYQTITRSPLSLADGVLLAFDAANEKSFDELLPWRKCIEQGSEQALVMLVATRADLYTTEVNNWCSHQLEGTSRDARCDGGFMKCSAMHDRLDVINKLFISLLDAALKRQIDLDAPVAPRNEFDTVNLRTATPEEIAAGLRKQDSRKTIKNCAC